MQQPDVTTGQQQQRTESEQKRIKSESRQPIGKVIELIGNSQNGFEDAIQKAVETANKSLDHITGVEVRRMSCEIRDGEIAEYRVDLKLAFGVEPEHLGRDHHG